MFDVKLILKSGHLINRYGNKILVTDELPDGQMVDQWEPVTQDLVKTPLEVCHYAFYSNLQCKNVTGVWVPILSPPS